LGRHPLESSVVSTEVRMGPLLNASKIIDAINAKYTPLIAAAGQTYSVSVIQAARKADFTGATRKYFATLCSDLYTTSSDPASQGLYAGWTSSATASSTKGVACLRPRNTW
jgi:hypothetical protein